MHRSFLARSSFVAGISLLAVLALALTGALAGAQAGSPEVHWPQWRGADMTGVASEANPPLRWSEDENVVWKVALPGPASATPVLWGSQLFVQGARTGNDEVIEFTLHALDRESGGTLWEHVVHRERPDSAIQPNNTWASGSPTVDPERVYAFFGSRGVYAFTHDGELLWETDLGEMRTRRGFGEGSSAGLHGDRLLVNWDQEDESWLVALDAGTGVEAWRVARDEPTTWYTPVVAAVGDRHVVVTAGTNAVRGYDLETGALLWSGPGLTLNAIPSPVIVDGVAYLTAGYRGEAMLALDLARASEGSGDDAVLWRHEQDTPYVASPLVYGGVVYFVKSTNGILTALDAATGERLYGPTRVEQLTDGVYASPIGAAGRVYLVGRSGTTVVLRAGREYEVLAVNSLDDGIDASPVAVGEDLFLRGKNHLYRITGAR